MTSNYRSLGELGRGSFGKVDKVRRKADGKICVCKQVSMDLFQTPKQRDQAHAEAQIMNGLDCPYIVAYLDAFLEKGCLFIILQYCDKGDLKGYLKKVKALEQRTMWRIFCRITLGMKYLHDKRILHRDMKSENIFLDGSEEGVHIGDLGLARMLTNTQTAASTLVGTPRYLSPEEIKGMGAYNDKCDVWSLGVILYEVGSDGHKTPFDSAKDFPELVKLVLEKDPPALPARVGDLKDVCHMLLMKDGKKRPSINEILKLDAVVENSEKHGVSEEQPSSEVAPDSISNSRGPDGVTSGNLAPAEADRCTKCAIQ